MNKLWSLIMTLERQLQILEASLTAGIITQPEHDAEVVRVTLLFERAAAQAAEEARLKQQETDLRDATGATKHALAINLAENNRIKAAYDRRDGNFEDAKVANRFAADLTRAVRGTSSSFNP